MSNQSEKKANTLYYKDFAKEQPLLESGLYELGVIRMLDTLAFNQEKYALLLAQHEQTIGELRGRIEVLEAWQKQADEETDILFNPTNV